MPPHTLLLVEDHAVVRQGLRALLAAQADFRIVGETGDGAEAILLAERLQPELLLLDLGLPGQTGLEVIRQLQRRVPRCRVVVLSVFSGSSYVLEALRQGAYGFISKEAPFEEVVQALREAIAGRRYLSPPLTEQELDLYLQRAAETPPEALDTLTRREREVLLMVAQGQTNAEIAARLVVSVRTVETHRANLMRKLDLHSPAELIHFVLRRGLLP
jgi:DNA-binding NarL/FixJ family response regulator